MFNIQTTFLDFPRLANDAEYLFSKLNPVLNLHEQHFYEVFSRVADPKAIHNFDAE
jgi:hypothetical protein